MNILTFADEISKKCVKKDCIPSFIDGQVNINTIREMVGHADERTTLNNYKAASKG